MKGIILYDGPESNDLKVMLRAAETLNVEIEVVNPHSVTPMLDPARAVMLIGGNPEPLPDFAIAAFAGDPSYANLATIAQLETMGVFCVNRASVMNTTKDKLLTLQRLARAGLPVSKTILQRPGTDVELYERELGFPLVLKVIGGSKGKGVVLVESRDHLEDLLGLAAAGGLREDLILQKFVANSKGRDLRVMIAGGEVVDCARRQTAEVDGFLANASAGGTMVNHPMDDEIRDLGNAVAKTLGLFIGGVDLLFDNDGYVVCEANSVPGIVLPRGMPSPWSIDMPTAIMRSIVERTPLR